MKFFKRKKNRKMLDKRSASTLTERTSPSRSSTSSSLASSSASSSSTSSITEDCSYQKDTGIVDSDNNSILNNGGWDLFPDWSDESVRQVAEQRKLTPPEIEKLWQLHDALQADYGSHPMNRPVHVVRLLRECRGNLARAEHKFRIMMQWRIEEQVDDILEDYVPAHPLMAKYVPSTILDGYDREGGTIWIERPGATDSCGLTRAFGIDELLRYSIYLREASYRGAFAEDYQRRNEGRNPTGTTAIIDLQGLSWQHIKPGKLALLKEGLRLTQIGYAGTGKRIIIIRAPAMFAAAWKVAQQFCGERLKKKMIFTTNDNYVEILEKYIDLDLLPPSIYPQGKGHGGIGMPNHLDGGKVPSKEVLDAMLAEQESMVNKRVMVPMPRQVSVTSLCSGAFNLEAAESSSPVVVACC